MRRALLLNASWEPLNFITDERALRLVLKGRAEIIANMDGEKSVWDGMFFHSVHDSFAVPATVRLLNRVRRRWKAPKFRKKVLFNRDGWKCGYCGRELNWRTAEIEHIVPKSHGGPKSWKNCVTACKQCNKRKADRTPAQAGMKLLIQPREPSALHFWDVMKCNSWHDDWELFVPRASGA